MIARLTVAVVVVAQHLLQEVAASTFDQTVRPLCGSVGGSHPGKRPPEGGSPPGRWERPPVGGSHPGRWERGGEGEELVLDAGDQRTVEVGPVCVCVCVCGWGCGWGVMCVWVCVGGW